jgi:hypothetical protein
MEKPRPDLTKRLEMHRSVLARRVEPLSAEYRQKWPHLRLRMSSERTGAGAATSAISAEIWWNSMTERFSRQALLMA